MTRLPIRHGLFAVGLPSGEWAVLLSGQHVLTHVGAVNLPGFDIGYLEITNTPAFRIAGQAQVESTDSRRGTWEWSRSRGWHHITRDAPGSYPVLYDSQGNLHIATPDQNGSQGWRYEDEQGVLVTGDDTLNEQRAVGIQHGITGLWEYSHFAGVTIGQGDPPMGCHVLIDGQRRLLEPGACFFIRVRYRDGRWAVSMTKLAESEAVLYWLTRDELSALSLVGTPEPTPPPEPEPPVSDYPAILEDQSALVREVRNTLFPDLVDKPLNDPQKAMAMTREVAKRLSPHGVGLLKAKPGSENNVGGFTTDIVALSNGVHWDIQQDGHDGAAFAQWSLVPQFSDGNNNWAAVAPRWVAVEGTPTPGPLPHVYDGGDNDTGICDRCGKPREDPIHVAVQPPTEPPLPDDRLARVEALLVSLGKHLGAWQ